MDSQQMCLKTTIEDASKSSVPSLKNLCVMRCAVELCNKKEVRDLIKCLQYPKDLSGRLTIKSQAEWQTISKIIIDSLNSVLIPKPLKDKILSYSFSIALEIVKGILRFQDYHLPDNFCWTVKGTIDGKNTAKTIIRNESVCYKKRFHLSCMYCLTNDVMLLKENMPNEVKDDLLNDANVVIELFQIEQFPILHMDAHLSSQVGVIFQHIVDTGNFDAIKFFISKMSTDMRQPVLERIFNHIVDTERKKTHFRIPEAEEADIWFLLFSYMTKDLQLKYFSSKYGLAVIFHMFFSSGRQKYLIRLMNLAIPNMESYHYHYICFLITGKYLNGYKDWNYRKTFIQFWREIPKSRRISMQRKGHLVINCFANLIRFYFPRFMGKGRLKSKRELISRSLKSHNLSVDCYFDGDKWKFLLFLIRGRLVTSRDITFHERGFVEALGIPKGKEQIRAFKRVMHFLNRIASKRPRRKRLSAMKFHFSY